MLEPYFQDQLIECGIDEAGRGSLSGSVYAAAVILSKDFRNDLLNDSKVLTDKQRRELRIIIQQNAIAYSVAEVDSQTIDEINILQASILAMNKAVKQLTIKPEFLIIDGNKFSTNSGIQFKTIVKGDSKYMSIAAASILAKTYRDDAMIELSKQYPNYNWQTNKGYPTRAHRQAIKTYGITPLHRKSFKLLPDPQLFEIDN